MTQRDRLDPESRAALELLFAFVPGGLNAIPGIGDRRAAFDALAAAVASTLPPNDRVQTEDLVVPGPAGAPDVGVRTYRPVGVPGTLPGIYFIHGGGMVIGSIESESLAAAWLCESVGALVVSVEYRLAPEHPYPAALDDCYAGLVWMAAHADTLGFDPARLAVYGGSAGGGLAIATAMTARDRRGPFVCFQMPVYPMIDDQNQTPSAREITDIGIWDRHANAEAWAWYLGGREADRYAAPARAVDLTGLPPTFIDVGEMDLFRDEDIAFAGRLLQAGIPTELHVYPGAYHASEMFAPDAQLSQRIRSTRIAALQRVLVPGALNGTSTSGQSVTGSV